MITKEKFDKYATVFSFTRWAPYFQSGWDVITLSHDKCRGKSDDDFIFYKFAYLCCNEFEPWYKVSLFQINTRLSKYPSKPRATYKNNFYLNFYTLSSEEVSQLEYLYDKIYIKCKINDKEVLFKKLSDNISSNIMKLVPKDSLEITFRIKVKDVLALPDKTNVEIYLRGLRFCINTNYREECLNGLKKLKEF